MNENSGQQSSWATAKGSRADVVLSRSSLVGSVIAMVSEQEGAKICWLAVHPKHRRQGVGTALVRNSQRSQIRMSCFVFGDH